MGFLGPECLGCGHSASTPASPYTSVGGAAQEKPRDHAQPGLQFLVATM